jgi:hypothetical protein
VSGEAVVVRISAVAEAGGWFVQIRDPRATRVRPAVEVATADGVTFGVMVPQQSPEVGQ